MVLAYFQIFQSLCLFLYLTCFTNLVEIDSLTFSDNIKLLFIHKYFPNFFQFIDYTEEEDSGDDSKYDNQKATFKIDDWISFRVDPEVK